MALRNTLFQPYLMTVTQTAFATLTSLQAVLLAFVSKGHVEYRPVFVASAALQLCAAVLLGVLSHWEHRNTVRPSFLLSAYLFLTSILDAARARTQSRIPGRHTVASILIAVIVTRLLLCFLENWDKTRILLFEYSEFSLELRSSLFSRAFFTWLNPTLYAGFKGVLSSEKLPAVNENLCSGELTTRVESRWKGGKSTLGVLKTGMILILTAHRNFKERQCSDA